MGRCSAVQRKSSLSGFPPPFLPSPQVWSPPPYHLIFIITKSTYIRIARYSISLTFRIYPPRLFSPLRSLSPSPSPLRTLPHPLPGYGGPNPAVPFPMSPPLHRPSNFWGPGLSPAPAKAAQDMGHRPPFSAFPPWRVRRNRI
jgi:hypothetical protein